MEQDERSKEKRQADPQDQDGRQEEAAPGVERGEEGRSLTPPPSRARARTLPPCLRQQLLVHAEGCEACARWLRFEDEG